MSSEDRRRALRIKTLVKAYLVQGKRHNRLITLSFSESGGFFHTDSIPRKGMEIEIVFPPKGERKHKLSLLGKITRVVEVPKSPTPYTGFGIKWNQTAESTVNAVHEILQEIYQSPGVEMFLDKGEPPKPAN
jgi:hypothetical protein